MTAGHAADLLLADGNEADAELARRLLERAGCRGVAVATSGEEALALLHGDELRRLAAMPRLVLLDPDLPGLDGFVVLERIRRHPASRMIPVVMFAGAADPREVARAYRLGANGVVPKPADYDRFAATMAGLAGYWLINAPPT